MGGAGEFESEIFDPEAQAAPVDADPGSEEAAYWNNLGNQLLQQQSYPEAIAAYTYAIELSPTVNWPYIRNLTTAHYRKGKSRGGQLAAPADEQPDAPAVTSPRSMGAVEAKPAVEDSSESVALPEGNMADTIPAPVDELIIPPSSATQTSLHRLIQQGNEQMHAGQFEEASQTYIQAIEKQPDFGWAYCNLALAYSHLGKDTYAVLALKKGIDYLDGDKEKAIAWRHLSEVYAKVGDPVNASFAMETALSLEREKTSLLQRARVMLLGNTTL
jgi:tetratricopeptide (TPR) repeat protein